MVIGSKSTTTSSDRREVSSGGLDLISLLPDCLILSILSLLPVKDAARTSVLSTRWLRLWTLAPLYLDISTLHYEGSLAAYLTQRGQEAWRVRTTNRILSVHHGPIPSCCLWGFFLDNPFIGDWLQNLIARGVRELSLCCADMDRFFPVPLTLLTYPSLLALKLSHCHFPEPPLPPRTFVNLRDLTFYFSVLTDDIISSLVSCSRALESLVITGCMGLVCIRISSPTLRRFTLNSSSDYGNEIDELIIRDAPNLERVMLHRSVARDSKVTISNTPKLELLGIVHMAIKILRIGGTFFEPIRMVGGLRTRWESLKTLAICLNFNDYHQVKIVADFLRCFPCLEKLDVQIIGVHSYREDYGFWEQQGSLDCLAHLKSVTVQGFEGRRTDLAFAQFLIAKARVLKVMTLLCAFRWTIKWMETVRCHLCLENRASLGLKVILKTETGTIHEFSTWDPVMYEF